jgi:hypothetical protein
MAGLEFSLPFYLSFSIDRANTSAPASFWKHQWEKHGSCSGLTQRDYFLSVYAASAGLALQEKLLPFGITFDNKRGHNFTFLRSSMEAAVGVPGALPARGAMECALAPGSSRIVLATVTVCLDKASLRPTACAAGVSGAEEETSTFPSTSMDDRETMAQLLSNAAARFDCSKAPSGAEIFLPALLNGNASSDQGWITARGSAWFLFAAFAALFPLLALAWLAARVAGRKHVRRPSGEIAIGGGGGGEKEKKLLLRQGREKGGGGGCASSSAPSSSFADRWLLPPRVVCNPSVAEDRVDVLEHALSLSRLEKTEHGGRGGGRELARALRALPVGAGITGEAARRVARLAFPADAASDASASDAAAAAASAPSSEPSQARLVFFVPGGATDEDVEAAAAAAADVSSALCCCDEGGEGGGSSAGGGGVAARGVTVLRCGGGSSSSSPSPSSALDWFATRSLTFDELVVCRVSAADDEDEGAGLVLLSTPAGLEDARARRARPAAHGPRGWELGRGGGGETRSPRVVSSRLAVASAVAASLSGDATSPPELDAATWAHWSRRRLSKAALFRLLLPFHADTRSYLAALDAAASFGLVSRKDVRDCGGPNALWGVLIDEMNDIASSGGRRFALDGLDSESVDADVEGDADRSEARAARRGGGGGGGFRAVRSRAVAPVVRGPAWLEGTAAAGGGGEATAPKGGGGAPAFFDAAAAAEAAARRVALALALRGGRAADVAAAAPKPPQQQQQQQQQQHPGEAAVSAPADSHSCQACAAVSVS